MIDFHSHIVYGVDDGSQSLDSSIKILREAKEAGIDKIILTPHYMEDYYIVPKLEIKEKIDILREECKKEKIDIELYQGNEIYISNHIDEFLKKDLACSLNDSRYVLFETPLNIEPSNLIEVIYKIKEMGKVPVLAHPERYAFIQENPNKLLDLFEMGVLFQSNYGSVIGLYGKNAEKTIKLLLKNNYIHFLGSDVHRKGNVYPYINDAKNSIIKIIGQEKFDKISDKNILKVIKDEEIEKEQLHQIKISFFSKLF
ncbi:MAG: protein tyrosine phosphatase [Clostridia bacterium]|nr:protein tyrosine phosphatase [Clostridia bacterium]